MSSILESMEYRKKKLFLMMSGMLLWEPIVGDNVAITDFCEQYYIRKHLRIY